MYSADEGLKSSTVISSFLIDPKEFSCPFNMAMNSPSTMWEWYAKPENVHRGVRFAAAMKGGVDRYPVETFKTGVFLYFIAHFKTRMLIPRTNVSVQPWTGQHSGMMQLLLTLVEVLGTLHCSWQRISRN